MSDIGKNFIRIDSKSKVTGEALYPGDINFSDQLYMKVLFARVPHAIVKNIDTSDAEKIPGVVLILTAKDVPNNEYGLGTHDQPVLCGPGSNKAFADHVRFYGDQVALVIAESEEIAQRARDLIKVEYEKLEVLTDVEEAFKESSTQIHPEYGSNTFCHYKVRHGDTDEAFKEADLILENTYRTPVQEHAYLQPEAGVSYYDDNDRITVVVAGQWAHEDQEQIAHSLNLPLDSIRIIYPAIGGAFGGREDMSVQIILALASLKLRQVGITRPVKIIWTREESIIGHHKRHPYVIKTKWGAKKNGKVIAAKVEIFADGGAYVYTSPKVLGNATLLCVGPYNIPNVKIDSYAIYTNNIPYGAFRGFGGPQAAFAAEMQMNKLAEILHMDPVEIRLQNILHPGDLLSVGTPLPENISLEKVITSCAEKAGWVKDANGKYEFHANSLPTSEKYLKRGVGFACGFKNVGFSFGAPENCSAIIELHGSTSIEKVILKHAGAEVGQGSHSVFVQIAAKALNLPEEMITLVASDTSVTKNSGSVSASRMTFMAGNAILGAANLALEKWKNEERPSIAEYKYIPPKTTPLDKETGECTPNFSYGYVAQAVESEIDTETGEVSIKRVICADDVGKAINPQQVEGQVEGAIVQATGYVIHENFVQKNGIILTDKFSTYLIPTVMDIPDQVDTIIVESDDPIGPYGAKGVGEMPFLPFAPAVLSSVQQATGIWFDDFPLTPDKVLSKLDES